MLKSFAKYVILIELVNKKGRFMRKFNLRRALGGGAIA